MDATKSSATETDPEFEAIVAHLTTGKPLDPELVRRVRNAPTGSARKSWKSTACRTSERKSSARPAGHSTSPERELTLAQRDLLRGGEGPPRLVNPDTGETYVLLSEEEYGAFAAVTDEARSGQLPWPSRVCSAPSKPLGSLSSMPGSSSSYQLLAHS